MADFAQRGVDILPRRGRPCQQRQALQQVLLDAFQAGLDLARQGFHQRYLGLVERVGVGAGGLAFAHHFKLAVLQQVMLTHMAVEHDADGQGQGQSADHEVAEFAAAVEIMEGDDRAGHGDGAEDQQVEQDRGGEHDDAGAGAGADHQEDFGVVAGHRRGDGNDEQGQGPQAAADALAPQAGLDMGIVRFFRRPSLDLAAQGP